MKKKILGIAALIVVIMALCVIYIYARPKPVEGGKHVVIKYVDDKQNTKKYELDTDAEYLSEAMEEAEGLSFEGEEGPYGIMVHSVNSLEVDFQKNGSYWAFYVNDDYCQYGIDEQVVNDGDVFRIEYTID